MRRLALTLALCGCGRIGFDQAASLDAAPPDTPEAPRCDPSKPYGPLMPLSQLSSPQSEIGVELADDGLVGFLWSDRTGMDQIYETSRATAADPLGPPRLVAPLMAGAADRDPCPTGDGLTMVFGSLRPGGGGQDWDLWLATRPSRGAPFAPPVPLTTINGPEADWGACLTSSGLALYYVVGTDLVVARRTAMTGDFAVPSRLSSLNTGSAEFEPAVTPDELTIVWASDRSGGKGGLDIYTAKRTSITASFESVTALAELNSGGDDIPSWISPDLCEIHMTQTNGANGWDLYYARKPL
jgi:hypothetical protein